MWGRRRKPKRGGQLERQLALGRLVDALAEVDRAQEEGAQIEERQREGTGRESTEPRVPTEAREDKEPREDTESEETGQRSAS